MTYLTTRFSPYIKAIQNVEVYSCGDQCIAEVDLVLPIVSTCLSHFSLIRWFVREGRGARLRSFPQVPAHLIAPRLELPHDFMLHALFPAIAIALHRLFHQGGEHICQNVSPLRVRGCTGRPRGEAHACLRIRDPV